MFLTQNYIINITCKKKIIIKNLKSIFYRSQHNPDMTLTKAEKTVIVVIDALRADHLALAETPVMPYLDGMIKDKMASVFVTHTSTPTVTMPRLKVRIKYCFIYFAIQIYIFLFRIIFH